MSQQGLENTFVIIILGNEANQASIDRSSGCRKYHNYSLYSNSVVISRLASFRGIPSDNIVVFGYGSPCGYDMDIVPTSDIFFQLTIDEIYKETKTHERISFPQNVKYFIEIEDISTFLHTKIRSKHPNFYVFIDDHDVDEQLDFFELYRLLRLNLYVSLLIVVVVVPWLTYVMLFIISTFDFQEKNSMTFVLISFMKFR